MTPSLCGFSLLVWGTRWLLAALCVNCVWEWPHTVGDGVSILCPLTHYIPTRLISLPYWSSFNAFILSEDIQAISPWLHVSGPLFLVALQQDSLLGWWWVQVLGLGVAYLLLWYYVHSRAIDICIYHVNFIYSEESLDSWVRTKQTESNYINFIHVHVSTMGFLWYLIVITFVEWIMSMSDSSIYFCIMLTIYNKSNTKSAWLSNFIKKSHKSL